MQRCYARRDIELINPLCQMFGAALAPAWAPHTMLQCVAAVMSGQNNPNIQLRNKWCDNSDTNMTNQYLF